jgi:hypothetical protein
MYMTASIMYMMAKRWTIATVRQHLPAVIASAAREPQRVYRRDKLVAAVVHPEQLERLEAAERPTLAERFAEAQRICSEDGYTLELPPRTTRADPFTRPKRTRKR